MTNKNFFDYPEKEKRKIVLKAARAANKEQADLMSKPSLFAIMFYILIIAFILFGIYLFYFAQCELVKKYWFLVYVPGRCL